MFDIRTLITTDDVLIRNLEIVRKACREMLDQLTYVPGTKLASYRIIENGCEQIRTQLIQASNTSLKKNTQPGNSYSFLTIGFVLLASASAYYFYTKTKQTVQRKDAETQFPSDIGNAEIQADLAQRAKSRSETRDVKSLFPAESTCSIPPDILLSYADNGPRMIAATQPRLDAAPAAQSGAEAAESSRHTSPRDALPSAGAAGLFGSRNSFLVPSSRAASNDDLDNPKTPPNSLSDAAKLMKTAAEETAKQVREKAMETRLVEPAGSSWIPWPFR